MFGRSYAAPLEEATAEVPVATGAGEAAVSEPAAEEPV